MLNLSKESNTLMVLASADDTVEIGSGWTFDGLRPASGALFDFYTQGAANLMIEREGPFKNVVELGGGWVSDWMGTFNINFMPWIFHAEHGWMFTWEDSRAGDLFAFDFGSGQWFFTTDESYPNLYSFARNSWIFYYEGTIGPRQFVDLQSGEFFSLD